MSTPEKDEFHLDLTFTGQNNKLFVPIAIAFAAVSIVFIIATMTTNVAATVLPMSDEYLQVLIPQAPDGKAPLSLQALENVIDGNTLSVTGTVMNRTDF